MIIKAESLDCMCDRLFKITVKTFSSWRREIRIAIPCKFEEFLQRNHTLLPNPFKLNVLGHDRRENFTSFACSRYQHIEPALSTFPAYWPNVLRQSTILVPSVADRNEDDISLVSLDIFQVSCK